MNILPLEEVQHIWFLIQSPAALCSLGLRSLRTLAILLYYILHPNSRGSVGYPKILCQEV